MAVVLSEDDQVPPLVASVNAIVELTQTAEAPPIAATVGNALTDTVAVWLLEQVPLE